MRRRGRTRHVVVAVGLLLAPRAEVDAQVAPAVVTPVSVTALTVVNVPVPARIAAGERVRYTVTPALPGAVVGQLTGSVVAGAPSRGVVFAVRASRRLDAGRVEIARVTFTSASLTIDVPVLADVVPFRDITIVPLAARVAAVSGGAARIGYRLTNTGNAPDTVAVSAIVPPGWSVVDVPAAIPLGVRETVDRVIAVRPPPRVQGTTVLRLVALSRGAPVAESRVDVQAGAGAVTRALPGPTLGLGAGAAVGPWTGTSAIQFLELDGPLSEGITIRARASSTPDQDGADYAFSRAGLVNGPFAMQLASPDWRLDGGTLGATVSDLTGVNLVGRGAAFLVNGPRWTASGVAATPGFGRVHATGSLAGGRLEYAPGAFSLSTALSRHRERRTGISRELDAVSLGGAVPALLGGRLGAELAHRRFDGGASPGWSASWARRTPDEAIDIRYAYAPGGSQAFARAVDEFSLMANRKLSQRVDVRASAWRSADEGGASVSTLNMDGWTLGSRFALDDHLHVSLTARQNGFGAATALGEFGSAERAVDAALELRRGAYSAHVTANAGSVERRTTLPDSVSISRSATRGGVRGLIALERRGTELALTGSYERTGAGVGAAPIQWAYGIRLHGAQDRPLRVEAAAERLGGALGAARSLMLRAGVELDLPARTTIRLSAERNPYVVTTAHASPWMYVVGLSRALSLPRVSGAGTRGVVYRDLNGNGQRESGEPGFAGVVLRRGAETAVTDSRGTFLLRGNENQSYEVDARSLPLGWILRSTLVPARARAIGAVSVSPLAVELALDPADTARVSAEHLAAVVVTVRDSTGREWVSRRVSSATHVFDALPPGPYTVLIDASASREPLRPSGDNRTAVVVTGTPAPPIRIVLRARGLRFSNPGRRSG
ncbi:MAG TPA: hypothetical protein VLE53_02810 [Gemmatimonadaceae bacterium]|nr:hypothetical protein [Gemmatimonadaceae bacterium]